MKASFIDKRIGSNLLTCPIINLNVKFFLKIPIDYFSSVDHALFEMIIPIQFTSENVIVISEHDISNGYGFACIGYVSKAGFL
jgi:hypothetical protein